ncbi:hypothetical protein [Acinetobacter wuhouensis]|uniref:Uncharacterized protein n=1 Tax=Acinetobacter wuhouensis TaxID=1879050 RepID=A0A4Q7AJT3_9GAMM|nr:hypothetical protein [Acinetobacter wuhouensis]RZG47028.1 hypothetical protein EXU28_07520 [Acinetobacter wuhouensis]
MKCPEFISLIANICTIVGFFVAVHLLCIWKKQQNYGFERDKVFELELATDQLFKESIYYIITKRDIIKARLEGNFDRIYFENEMRLRLTNWQICLKEYDLKLSSLNVLKKNYDKEILVTATQIQNHFDEIVDKMHNELDAQKAIQDFDQKYIIQANVAKELVLTHLREIREGI